MSILIHGNGDLHIVLCTFGQADVLNEIKCLQSKNQSEKMAKGTHTLTKNIDDEQPITWKIKSITHDLIYEDLFYHREFTQKLTANASIRNKANFNCTPVEKLLIDS